MLQDLTKARDKVDMEMVQLIAQRLDLTRQIIETKKQNGEELHLRTDEIASLDKAKLVADSLGIEETLITDVFALIFNKERGGA